MAATISFSVMPHAGRLSRSSCNCSCNPRSIATACPSFTSRLMSAGAATVDHFTAPISVASGNLLREFSLSGSSGPSGRPGMSSIVPRIGNDSGGGFQTGTAEIPKSVRKAKEAKTVTLVDPVEAKRLAALEMTKILAAKRFKRQTEIEAINGGWAVLGLTAGIVIDGATGNSILVQLAGYLDVVNGFVTRITPPGFLDAVRDFLIAPS